MKYEKGNISWSKLNKGKYRLPACTEETKEKISKGNTKPKVSKNCLACEKQFEMIPSLAKTKRYCSKKCQFEGQKGKTTWNSGLKGFRTGKRPGIMPIGVNHWSYKKDRTVLVKKQERNDPAYKEWRKEVWLRDNFKCKIENPDCQGKIEAHHILPWRDYPELRYKTNNGITLCHAHHPRKRAEEKRLEPLFMELVSVSNG